MKNKGLSVLLSFALVLVLAVSFSVPVQAANSVECDILWELSSSWDSDVQLASDSAWSKTVSSTSGSQSLCTPTNGQLSVGFDEVIPANSRVTLKFTIWLTTTDVSNTILLDPILYFDLDGPTLQDIAFQASHDITYNDTNVKCNYVFTFDTIAPVYEILFNNFYIKADIERSADTSYYKQVRMTYGSLSYETIDDNPNGEVLDQIESNTGQTTDAVNNQTDTLTSGYDSSSIDSSNTALSGSISEYDQTESQITDQSVGFIDDVEFYDLGMQPQLLTCITFCSSWLQSLFVNLGDWGILIMVSLSLSLGLMLIGWFKYRK